MPVMPPPLIMGAVVSIPVGIGMIAAGLEKINKYFNPALHPTANLSAVAVDAAKNASNQSAVPPPSIRLFFNETTKQLYSCDSNLKDCNLINTVIKYVSEDLSTSNSSIAIEDSNASALIPFTTSSDTSTSLMTWMLENPITATAGVVGILVVLGGIAAAYYKYNTPNTSLLQTATNVIQQPFVDTNKIKLIEQLDVFEKHFEKLGAYAATQTMRESYTTYLKTIGEYKEQLKKQKLDKALFATGKELLSDALKLMEKTSFETHGGVESEKGLFFSIYHALVSGARKALNLFTQLFVLLGLASHKDVENPIAKALVGRSFFMQVTPTTEESKVIEAEKQVVLDANASVEELSQCSFAA